MVYQVSGYKLIVEIVFQLVHVLQTIPDVSVDANEENELTESAALTNRMADKLSTPFLVGSFWVYWYAIDYLYKCNYYFGDDWLFDICDHVVSVQPRL